MSECQAYRREIDEAADGGAMGAGARAHASSCRACAGELRARDSLRALVGGLGKVEAPADFEFRLRARMAASKSGGGHGRFGGARWLYGFAPVAVAACFVVVSATLYFRQAARTPTTVAPAVAAGPAHHAEPDRAPPVDVQSPGVEPAVAVGETAGVSPRGAASPRSYQSARKARARVTQAREVASGGEGRADGTQRTLVYSETGAQVIRLIPVNAPAEPLRVILRDASGAERVVTVRGVSFGSQDFIARRASDRPSVAAEVEGVW